VALAILASMDASLRSFFVLFELEQASLRALATSLSAPRGMAKARLRKVVV
jgi:hypothetical protein